ncbi:18127_t:CDS:2 [Dentiscutata erythropus]|uniref:18127_t:CDS:1 n=1 Tax=Dentiscutata erythropus TaxID=1348616 RepID=A0A9N9E0D0_9GLOM|nr:18127_t:CDS:2 [Dentiscutata erythropus]
MITQDFTIRSDGQTGVAKGVLDAAMNFDEINPKIINIVGYRPLNNRSENGIIEQEYSFLEDAKGDKYLAIEKNIENSQGTLILLLENINADKETNHAIKTAKDSNKPLEIIYLHENSENKNADKEINTTKDSNKPLEKIYLRENSENSQEQINQVDQEFMEKQNLL